jgi:tetraacyldisaccharide 4'-kinase
MSAPGETIAGSHRNHQLNQETYRNLVSGQTSGPLAALARLLLVLLSWPYSLAVRVRNGLYSLHLLRTHRVDAVVISAGNLTTGGTGKTPLVVRLCRLVRQRGLRCAILTRGYKAQEGEKSDEPALLAAECPDANVVVEADRVAGAKQAIHKHSAQVLILDDGFQHRRLARNIDIVTIDATLPFGYGKLLPAGLLREPVAGLRRADAVVITRCDQVSEERLAWIEEQVRRIHPQAIVATSIHAPVGAAVQGGGEIGLEELRGKRVFAFCGLGNPEAFFDTVRRIGCILVGSRSFDDHCVYTRECLHEVHRQAKEHNADFLLTTQKDWTKIAKLPPPQGGTPLACLDVELEFIRGVEPLTALIEHALNDTIRHGHGPGK